MNVKENFYSAIFIAFCISTVLLINTVLVQPAFAMQSVFCRVPSSIGFSINSQGRVKIFKPHKIYYSPYALPRGSDPFWYTTRTAPSCEIDSNPFDFTGLAENEISPKLYQPGVYALEYPQPDGTIVTQIGETGQLGTRYSQHRDALRLGYDSEKAHRKYFDKLQKDFPDEKEFNGYVYPRYTILEHGGHLTTIPARVECESKYKAKARQDPERILTNPEDY